MRGENLCCRSLQEKVFPDLPRRDTNSMFIEDLTRVVISHEIYEASDINFI